jgi:hypothetical protein
LRPGSSPERGSPASLHVNEPAEALERLNMLKPAKKPVPIPDKPAEAIERLQSLRPSSPTKRERVDEGKVALERTISTLRPSSPQKHVPVDEMKRGLLAAKVRLHSQTLSDAIDEDHVNNSFEAPPGRTPDRSKSRSFQDDLASALMRGPAPTQEVSPPALRKASTFDSADIARNESGKLVHRTKTRARGPKRRLPTSAVGNPSSDATASLSVGKTRNSNRTHKVPPAIRKSSRAVSSSIPAKPRKPSTSVAM